MTPYRWLDRRIAAPGELRRLHAECNDLAHQLNESNERNGQLKAQRDALLEALKGMRHKYGEYACSVCDHADASIKAVEEGK